MWRTPGTDTSVCALIVRLTLRHNCIACSVPRPHMYHIGGTVLATPGTDVNVCVLVARLTLRPKCISYSVPSHTSVIHCRDSVEDTRNRHKRLRPDCAPQAAPRCALRHPRNFMEWIACALIARFTLRPNSVCRNRPTIWKHAHLT